MGSPSTTPPAAGIAANPHDEGADAPHGTSPARAHRTRNGPAARPTPRRGRLQSRSTGTNCPTSPRRQRSSSTRPARSGRSSPCAPPALRPIAPPFECRSERGRSAGYCRCHSGTAAQGTLHEAAEIVGVLTGEQQSAVRRAPHRLARRQLAGPEAAVRAECSRVVGPIGVHAFSGKTLGAWKDPIDLGDYAIGCLRKGGEGRAVV